MTLSDPSRSHVRFYHGGPLPVIEIEGNRFGSDGELLCASRSVNVAMRYGRSISIFDLNSDKVFEVSRIGWMSGSSPSIRELRDQGYEAMIVSGDGSFDFPVDTIFVIDRAALSYKGVLSSEECRALDDGRARQHDPSPSHPEFPLYVQDVAESLKEALSNLGWEKFGSSGYIYRLPATAYSPAWSGIVQCKDRKWQITSTENPDARPVRSLLAGLSLLDSGRLEAESLCHDLATTGGSLTMSLRL